MIGMVLAAGAGRRLHPLTDDLPKTLLPVAGERSILETTLGNLKHVGIDEVVVVVGFAAHRVREVTPELSRRYGLHIELVDNDKAEVWNNAYSLWCAREHFARGVLLVNGDTVHPPVVEERLLAQRGPAILLAVDREKTLGEEEMKVTLGADGTVARITKLMDPAEAAGEYIGLTLIEPEAGPGLTDALEATFSRDPQLYYEDGYQELVSRGTPVSVAPIGAVEWVEVDNHEDLARARDIACRF
jgi:choline kinase